MIDFVALALYSTLMGSTPGPNNVMLTASGVNFGFARTLPHMLGIACGHVVQVMLACLSLGEIFVRYPLTQRSLKIAGFCYLLYLSWRILMSSSSSEKQGAKETFAFLRGGVVSVCQSEGVGFCDDGCDLCWRTMICRGLFCNLYECKTNARLRARGGVGGRSSPAKARCERARKRFLLFVVACLRFLQARYATTKTYIIAYNNSYH